MLRAGLKLLLKDALRGARFTMRQATPPVPVVREISQIADDVLTSLEETVVSLRHGPGEIDDAIGTALRAYKTFYKLIGDAEFEQRFAAVNYRLAKGILERRGFDTVLLSELAYARAGAALAEQALLTQSACSVAEFGAKVSLGLIAADPVRVIPGRRSDAGEDDAFVANRTAAVGFTVGLAVTAFIGSGTPVNAIDCVTSAGDLVNAAFARLSAAQTSETLAPIYAELSAFVP